jgi:hypothetical protein
MKKRLRSEVVASLNYNFAPRACAILAFSCPLYTGETRSSWGHKISVTGNVIKVTVGNTANQAVYCEYGTLSKLVATKQVSSSLVGGILTVTKDKSVKLDSKGGNANDEILKWCDFKGITDPKIRGAIVHSLLTKGRSVSSGGLASSIPELIRVYKEAVTT